MRQNAYIITFVDGKTMEEWAFTSEQAKILAQAKRIKQGEEYKVKKCKFISPLPN